MFIMHVRIIYFVGAQNACNAFVIDHSNQMRDILFIGRIQCFSKRSNVKLQKEVEYKLWQCLNWPDKVLFEWLSSFLRMQEFSKYKFMYINIHCNFCNSKKKLYRKRCIFIVRK